MLKPPVSRSARSATLIKQLMSLQPNNPNKFSKLKTTTTKSIITQAPEGSQIIHSEPITDAQQTPTTTKPFKTTTYFAETKQQIYSSPFVRINDFPFGTTREDIVSVLNRFGVTPKRLSPHYIFSPFMRLLAWYAELNDSQQVHDLVGQWNNHPVKKENFLSLLHIAEKDTVFLPNNGYHKKAVLFYGLPYDVEKRQIEKFIGNQFKDFHIEIELQDAHGDTPRQARAFVIMNSEEEAHRPLLFRHKKTFSAPVKNPTMRPTQITVYALMLE